MMLVGRAEAGHASKLDSLPAVIDLGELGIHGGGCLQIDEIGSSSRMAWNPKTDSGPSFFSQGEDGVGKTLPALAQFEAETVALGGASIPSLDTATVAIHGGRPDAYMSRIKFLQNEALHDGNVLNPASEFDFNQFVRSERNIRKGNLVLMDNGNLRAIWKGEQGSHLGLQFLGGGMVQYVIFKRREHGQQISRVSGRDSLEGLVRQIDAFELSSLLYG